MPVINSITQKAEHFIRSCKRKTKHSNPLFDLNLCVFTRSRYFPLSLFSWLSISFPFCLLQSTCNCSLNELNISHSFLFCHTKHSQSSMCLFSSLLVRLRTFLWFSFSIEMFVWWWIGVHRFFCVTRTATAPYRGENESSIKRSKRNSNKKINFVCLVCVCDESIFNVRFSLFHCDFTSNTQKGFLFYALFPSLSHSACSLYRDDWNDSGKSSQF